MIAPLINSNACRNFTDYQREIAETNANLISVTNDLLHHGHKYWLGVPIQVNEFVLSLLTSLNACIAQGKEESEDALEATIDILETSQAYSLGALMYMNDFTIPFWTALNSFTELEKEKLVKDHLLETVKDYLELLQFNLQVAENGFTGTLSGMAEHNRRESLRVLTAWLNTVFAGKGKGEDLKGYAARQARRMNLLVYGYPQAIMAIKAEYGFHFDDGGYLKTAETDRFILYQVLPRGKKVRVRQKGKPIIIIPPYVLGPNILAFLPGERKSYVHAFANQGIPTYIRVMKDIGETPAVQIITGEDDALDTRFFCEQVKAAHGRKVTLNGFCQGGFIAVIDILSGELDGLVDAFITCVAPMDGTRSKALVEYLQHLPLRFRDLGYAAKVLPNGNRVVDGKVMSWVYKLKSMEKEFALVALHRDLMNLEASDDHEVKIGKTAAAMNHWLIYDRSDLPEAITKLSFDSYTIPVEKDGTLPVKLFGKKLNFKGIQEKGVKWLICYAEKDDLVDKESALAPLDFIAAEVTAFPNPAKPEPKYLARKCINFMA